MTELPLDKVEPFSSTLGIMLYPGLEDDERRKARAFASHYVAVPLRRAIGAGYRPTYDHLVEIATGSVGEVDDSRKRVQRGLWTGDIFKTLYALSESHTEYASVENAVRVLEKGVAEAGTRGSRTEFFEAKKQFLRVGHLWAAWSLRDGQFVSNQQEGYSSTSDFYAFLAVSEIFRDWGQKWKPRHTNAKHPLPDEVWRVPEAWRARIEAVGWPAVRIPPLALPEKYLKELKRVRP